MTDCWTKYRYCFKCGQTIPFDEWAVTKNYQFTVINKCSSCGHQTYGAHPVLVVLAPFVVSLMALVSWVRYSKGEMTSSDAIPALIITSFYLYFFIATVKKHKVMKSIYQQASNHSKIHES